MKHIIYYFYKAGKGRFDNAKWVLLRRHDKIEAVGFWPCESYSREKALKRADLIVAQEIRRMGGESCRVSYAHDGLSNHTKEIETLINTVNASVQKK